MDVRTEKSSLIYLKTLKISPKFWYEKSAFECFQILFEVHCLIRDHLPGKKWPEITDIRFVCYRGKKKLISTGPEPSNRDDPLFFFSI